MIAAIARLNGGRLAIRNLPDFETTGLELISPAPVIYQDAEQDRERPDQNQVESEPDIVGAHGHAKGLKEFRTRNAKRCPEENQ